jgi:RNA polymerase sigma factor (sigma-70 family)
MVWSIVNRLHGMPCVRALGDEEAYSVGCMTLIRCADGFNPVLGNQFSTYAYRAIKVDIIRAAKRHVRHGKQLAGEGEIACVVEESDVDVEMVPKLMQRLSPQRRQVIDMFYGLGGYEPVSAQEIADAMSCTPSNIQAIRSRALKEMRQ